MKFKQLNLFIYVINVFIFVIDAFLLFVHYGNYIELIDYHEIYP